MRNTTIIIFVLFFLIPFEAPFCQSFADDEQLPVVCRYSIGDGDLYIMGVKHTSDYSDPQIEAIMSGWDSFTPDIAFSEGGIWQLEPSLRAAVNYGGEGGLLRFLAERDTVLIMSLEMPESLQVRELVQDYTVEQIKLYLVMEYIPQYFRMAHRENFDLYVAKAIRSVNKIPGLDGYLRNVAELGESVRGLLPELGDWRRVDDRWISPLDSLGYSNDIARQRSAMRNAHMSRLLVQSVQNGQKAFAVVGLSHLRAIEPYLASQLGEKRKSD